MALWPEHTCDCGRTTNAVYTVGNVKVCDVCGPDLARSVRKLFMGLPPSPEYVYAGIEGEDTRVMQKVEVETVGEPFVDRMPTGPEVAPFMQFCTTCGLRMADHPGENECAAAFRAHIARQRNTTMDRFSDE